MKKLVAPVAALILFFVALGACGAQGYSSKEEFVAAQPVWAEGAGIALAIGLIGAVWVAAKVVGAICAYNEARPGELRRRGRIALKAAIWPLKGTTLILYYAARVAMRPPSRDCRIMKPPPWLTGSKPIRSGK